MSETISLQIQQMNSDRFSLTVLKGCSVADLKDSIQAQEGIQIIRQRLIFHGKVLKNEKLINEYQIDNGHTVQLVVSPVGAEVPRNNEPPIPSTSSTSRGLAPNILMGARFVLPSGRNPISSDGEGEGNEEEEEEHILGGDFMSNLLSSLNGSRPRSGSNRRRRRIGPHEHLINARTMYSNINNATIAPPLENSEESLSGGLTNDFTLLRSLTRAADPSLAFVLANLNENQSDDAREKFIEIGKMLDHLGLAMQQMGRFISKPHHQTVSIQIDATSFNPFDPTSFNPFSSIHVRNNNAEESSTTQRTRTGGIRLREGGSLADMLNSVRNMIERRHESRSDAATGGDSNVSLPSSSISPPPNTSSTTTSTRGRRRSPPNNNGQDEQLPQSKRSRRS